MPPLRFLLPLLRLSVLAALVSSASAQTAARRPNIVFILSDDHAWQAISAYGDSRHLVETPSIDRLAREGVRFDRCLVPNPLCGPSRACFLTGTYNHVNGFVNNINCRFDSSQPTYASLLHAAGYQTAVVGKWHLETDPVGFDFWQILPGQGVYYNPPMVRNGEEIHPTGYVTHIITDASLAWLEQRDPAKPFLLICGQKAPHRWWEPALDQLGRDQGRVYPEPPTLFDDYSGRGPAEHNQRMEIARDLNPRDLKFEPMSDMDSDQRRQWDAYYGPLNERFHADNPKGRDLVRWKYQRYMQDYLACVRSVDESVGRILDYLDRHGLAENTIVVYSSDQGFFLGEHGWFDKRWIFEESLRTPLLIRWPGVAVPQTTNADIVANIDLAETFLEAAGQPVPARMQGRSLIPLLRGRTPADWRKSFYFQYFEYPANHYVRPHYGVVTDRYKLVRFDPVGEPYWELFDRQRDPQELKSVYDDPAYAQTRTELAGELDRLRRELGVPARIPDAWVGGSGN